MRLGSQSLYLKLVQPKLREKKENAKAGHEGLLLFFFTEKNKSTVFLVNEKYMNTSINPAFLQTLHCFEISHF